MYSPISQNNTGSFTLRSKSKLAGFIFFHLCITLCANDNLSRNTHFNNRIRGESRYMNSQCCMQNMAPKRLRNSSFLSRLAWSHCKTPFNPSSSPHCYAPCSLSIGVSIMAPTNHCLSIRALARLGSLTFPPLPSHASTLSLASSFFPGQLF